MFMKSAYTCLCPRICINGVQTLTGRSKIRENHFQIHYVILKQAGDWCVGGAPSLKVDFSNLPQKPSPGTQKKLRHTRHTNLLTLSGSATLLLSRMTLIFFTIKISNKDLHVQHGLRSQMKRSCPVAPRWSCRVPPRPGLMN